jgi:hypothetical protein
MKIIFMEVLGAHIWEFKVFEKDERNRRFVLKNRPLVIETKTWLTFHRCSVVKEGVILVRLKKQDGSWQADLFDLMTGQVTGQIVWKGNNHKDCQSNDYVCFYILGKSAIGVCSQPRFSTLIFFERYDEETLGGKRIIKLGQGTTWYNKATGILHPLCARDGIFAMVYYYRTRSELSVDVIRVPMKDDDNMTTTHFKLILDLHGSNYSPGHKIYVIKKTILLIFNECFPTKIYAYDVVEKDGRIEVVPYSGNPIVTRLIFRYMRHFLDNDGNYYDILTGMTQRKRKQIAFLKVTSIKMYKIEKLTF